jgi:hypothetical protein
MRLRLSRDGWLLLAAALRSFAYGLLSVIFGLISICWV